MFNVRMLPARYGDCLWVEYGDAAKPKRILIDGGVAGTYDAICERIKDAGQPCEFELLVITHVDADHIEGIVKLLSNLPAEVVFRRVWFNGWKHLPASTRLGAPQGEKLTVCLVDGKYEWNEDPVVVPEVGGLPEVTLPGDFRLTLLSPTQKELERLAPKWIRECKKAGLVPGSLEDAREALERDRKLGPKRLGPPDVRKLAETPYEPDHAEANGSSIGFFAEYNGKSCLFGADAHSEVLAASIRKLLQRRGGTNLTLDAYKVSHHGSQFNNSPELFGLIQARQYLFSTNGDQFQHPDAETVARLLKIRSDSRVRDKATLCFNYSTDFTTIWNSTGLGDDWKYRVIYPNEPTGGLVVAV